MFYVGITHIFRQPGSSNAGLKRSWTLTRPGLPWSYLPSYKERGQTQGSEGWVSAGIWPPESTPEVVGQSSHTAALCQGVAQEVKHWVQIEHSPQLGTSCDDIASQTPLAQLPSCYSCGLSSWPLQTIRQTNMSQILQILLTGIFIFINCLRNENFVPSGI